MFRRQVKHLAEILCRQASCLASRPPPIVQAFKAPPKLPRWTLEVQRFSLICSFFQVFCMVRAPRILLKKQKYLGVAAHAHATWASFCLLVAIAHLGRCHLATSRAGHAHGQVHGPRPPARVPRRRCPGASLDADSNCKSAFPQKCHLTQD